MVDTFSTFQIRCLIGCLISWYIFYILNSLFDWLIHSLHFKFVVWLVDTFSIFNARCLIGCYILYILCSLFKFIVWLVDLSSTFQFPCLIGCSMSWYILYILSFLFDWLIYSLYFRVHCTGQLFLWHVNQYKIFSFWINHLNNNFECKNISTNHPTILKRDKQTWLLNGNLYNEL